MSDPRRKLRRFGFTVGTALLVLGVISRLRGHGPEALGLSVAASVLLALALVLPQALGPIERVWMRLAMILSWINTRIILSVLFVVAFTPAGVVRKMFRDPLDRRFRDGRSSYWLRRERKPSSRLHYERQF